MELEIPRARYFDSLLSHELAKLAPCTKDKMDKLLAGVQRSDAKRFHLQSDKLKEALIDQGKEHFTKLQATFSS